MRRIAVAFVFVFAVFSFAGTAGAQKPTEARAPAAAAAKPAASGDLKTDDEKILYVLGLAISRNLGPFALTESELALVKQGLSDGVLNRPAKVDLQAYAPKIEEFTKRRLATAATTEKKAGTAFLEKAAAEPGAAKQPTGFVYREVKAGTGPSPKTTDKVKVHYTGTLIDGTVFDSSVQRGEPATFPLNQVIPCWTQGLQLMKAGGKAKLVCPSELAYGDGGSPPRIKGGSTLVFDVELLSIEKAETAKTQK
jgi:FKBP-type peptidyl-prolyl cis-trans isomerase FkpA/FKBP-type peptidyl-prolyl cis-trans isomerase FklB